MDRTVLISLLILTCCGLGICVLLWQFGTRLTRLDTDLHRPTADAPEPVEADGPSCSEAQPGMATYTLLIAGLPVAITLWDTDDVNLTVRAEAMIEFYQEKRGKEA